MTQVTSAEFQKNFGTYKRVALNEPVEITIHGKATLVVLSNERYQQLLAGVGQDAPSTPEASAEPSLEDQLSALERIANEPAGVQFQDDPVKS